jgi:hypothetical protein
VADLGALTTLLNQGVSDVQGALGEARTASRARERDVAAALDQATQAVLAQREGRVNLPLLMWASGMGQPTRAGSFAESMGQGLQMAGPAIAAGRQEENERNKQLSQFAMARAQLPHQGAMERLQMAGMPLDIAGKVGPTLLQMRELELFQKAFQDAYGPGGGPGAAAAGAPPGGTPPGGGGTPLPDGMSPGFGSPNWARPPAQGPGAAAPSAGGPIPGSDDGGDPAAAATVAQWVRMGEALLRSGSQKLLPIAQQMLSRAEAAAKDGQIVGNDGVVRILPGAIRAQVAREVAVLKAKTDATPVEGVTPSGTTVRGLPGQLAQVPPGGSAPTAPAPTTPVIAPNSSALEPIIPPAPADGGWTRDQLIPPGTVPTKVSPQRAKILEEAGKFEADLPDQGRAADDIYKQVLSMAHAYKQFTTGPFSEQKQSLANLSELLGFKDLGEKIRDGDPAAAEYAKKNVLGMALKTLKEANSRFTQMEFQKIATEGSASGEIRPAAAHAMLREALASVARDRDLAAAWSQAQAQGWQNPLEFSTQWRKANPKELYFKQADRLLGNFKGMDLPKSADDWVPGTVYVAPDKFTGVLGDKLKARGIQPGTMFRMNHDRNFEPFTGFNRP